MFHEKYGFMLNFWNIAGVPFLYCFQSLYILRNQDAITNSLPWWMSPVVATLLIVGYIIFDTANCQKASYKLPGVDRGLFPQMPNGILKAPVKVIATPRGNLLIDGCYGYARKLQYTGDIMMALSWGLACGFGSLLPYFYVCFFTTMICHRQWRDEERCREKYGKYWDQYVRKVPHIFIPGVI